jgi:molybdopterin-guanine dinucleotide biosynthesis protein A
MRLVGVVLAGGQSSRMGGGHKGLLLLDGSPMLSHVVTALTPQVDALLINSNGDPQLFEPFRLPVLGDCVAGHLGPLAGLLTGMRWAHQHYPAATYLLSAPCDVPHLPPDLASRLTESLANGAQIAIARDPDRIHPTLGLWPISLAERLAHELMNQDVRAMRLWLANFAVREVLFDAASLRNVNTPEDLDDLRKQSPLPRRPDIHAIA